MKWPLCFRDCLLFQFLREHLWLDQLELRTDEKTCERAFFSKTSTKGTFIVGHSQLPLYMCNLNGIYCHKTNAYLLSPRECHYVCETTAISIYEIHWHIHGIFKIKSSDTLKYSFTASSRQSYHDDEVITHHYGWSIVNILFSLWVHYSFAHIKNLMLNQKHILN